MTRRTTLWLIVAAALFISFMLGIYFYFNGKLLSFASVSPEAITSSRLIIKNYATEKPAKSQKIQITRFSGVYGRSNYSELENICSNCITDYNGSVSFQAMPTEKYMIKLVGRSCSFKNSTIIENPSFEVFIIPAGRGNFTKELEIDCTSQS